jgi:hypothetical protein
VASSTLPISPFFLFLLIIFLVAFISFSFQRLPGDVDIGVAMTSSIPLTRLVILCIALEHEWSLANVSSLND